MPKKLKYNIKNNKKIYTLKEGKDAHYKFINSLVPDAEERAIMKEERLKTKSSVKFQI